MNIRSLLLPSLIALSLLPSLPACREQTSAPSSPLDSGQAKSQRPISLSAGESVELDASGLTLQFLTIKEDSRCPRNTACIQEGRVTALFTVYRKSESNVRTFQLTLKTLQPGLAAQNIEGYTIKLNRVVPYPEPGTAKSERTYTVTLVIGQTD